MDPQYTDYKFLAEDEKKLESKKDSRLEQDKTDPDPADIFSLQHIFLDEIEIDFEKFVGLEDEERIVLLLWRDRVQDKMESLQGEYLAVEKENRDLRVELALMRAEIQDVRREMDLWRRQAENLVTTEEEVLQQYQEDFLLSSLDHILFEKQKQVYLLSGIQNSLGVDRPERKGATLKLSWDTEDHSGKVEKVESEVCERVGNGFHQGTKPGMTSQCHKPHDEPDPLKENIKMPKTRDNTAGKAAVPNKTSPRRDAKRKFPSPTKENGGKTIFQIGGKVLADNCMKSPASGKPEANVEIRSIATRGEGSDTRRSLKSNSETSLIERNGAPKKEDEKETTETDSLASLRKLQPKLKLDLKKNYDYKPKRTGVTPISCNVSSVAPPWDSSFPPTPTPSGALRPSLSLHNLASRNFTEVLIPTLAPPTKHVVHPSTSTPISPVSKRIAGMSRHTSPQFNNTIAVAFCKH